MPISFASTCSKRHAVEMARLPKWGVSVEYHFDGMSGSEAVASSLPVDRGPLGPEPIPMKYTATVRALDAEAAGALAQAQLRRQCTVKGLPGPTIGRVTAWRPGRFPVHLDGGDGPGSSGVREPRRPSPTSPPPAAATVDDDRE